MRKRKVRQQKSPSVERPKRGAKIVIATAILVSLFAAWTMLTYSGARDPVFKQKGDKNGLVSTASFNSSSPSKEYIYAGGRLIATEEPPRSGADIDGDGRADIAFYRDGLWGFLKSSLDYDVRSPRFFSWGAAQRAPLYADFDGDQKVDLAYITPASGGQNGVYSILRSTTGYSTNPGQPLFVSAGFPAAADVPVVGDFDGDGKADPSMWKASSGVWTIPRSSANYTTFISAQWGVTGDIPIVCDLDGDGKADMGFHRSNGLWGFLKSSQGFSFGSAQFFSWGGAGKQPVVGDFDGDGKADIGYVQPPAGGQSATYAILLSTRGYSFAAGQVLFVPAGFPSLGDTPVVGDWDADGRADPAIWRASQGIWIIPLSSSNYASYLFAQWGVNGDIPIPNSTTQY